MLVVAEKRFPRIASILEVFEIFANGSAVAPEPPEYEFDWERLPGLLHVSFGAARPPPAPSATLTAPPIAPHVQ